MLSALIARQACAAFISAVRRRKTDMAKPSANASEQALDDLRALLAEAERLDRGGDAGRAAVLAQEAHQRASALSAFALAAEASLRLSRIASLDDSPRAIALCEKGLQEAAAGRGIAIEARIRAFLSALLSGSGQLERAIEEGRLAVELAAGLGQPIIAARASIGLGLSFAGLGQIEDAAQAFEQALESARQSGDLMQLAVSWSHYGICHERHAWSLEQQGETVQARLHYQRAAECQRQAMAACENVGIAPELRSQQMLNLAYSLLKLGDLNEIESLVQAGLALGGGLPDQRAHGLSLRILGELRLLQGLPAEARTLIEQSITASESVSEHEYTMNSLVLLSRACEASGDLRAALDMTYRHHDMYVEAKTQHAQRRARALAVQLETARAKAQAELERVRAEELERSNRALVEGNARLSRTNVLDGLTGLYNRRRLDAVVRNHGRRRRARPFCLAVLDVDHFKRVNDTYSHLVGDEVLRRLGGLVRASCRRDDLPIRMGGEEIALILYDLDTAGAAKVCERLRQAVQDHDWHEIHPDLRVTVSIGLAAYAGTGTLDDLLAGADRCLYAAKHAGRNRVVHA
jgi:two-component system cell cycle response regulator